MAELGYEPVGFVDPRTALLAFAAEPRRFDAVLTDEVMPAMNGTDLAWQVQAIRPAIPVVIASGYTGAGFEARALAAGIREVLRKPYTRDDLKRVLARILK